MRLFSLELSGFRGFSKKQIFDLNADAVVVIGANGHGKTSLFDGILWALSGRIPRLKNNDARLVSLYSDTGQARVELCLQDPLTGNKYTVTRSFDGTDGRITIQTPEDTFKGPTAEGWLINLLWPDAASASNPSDALASVLTRSVYLQQDLIRQFIEATPEQERFEAVSELVGAGRVTELQTSLERAKKAWSTATNQRQDEIRPLQERLKVMEARLSEVTARASQTSPAITPEAWDQWWQNLSTLGLIIVNPVEPSSREAPAIIDSAIKQLESKRHSTERRLQVLGTANDEMMRIAKRPIAEITQLNEKVAGLRKQLEHLNHAIAEEQERLAELRHQQVTLQEKTEQLKAFADLALKHLGDYCPVCAQTYDKEATRLRLETMVKGESENTQILSDTSKLGALLNELEAKEKETTAAELALRSAEQEVNEWQITQQNLNKRLSELGIIAGNDVGRHVAITTAIAEANELIKHIAELQNIGESLSFRLAQSSAVSAIDELRREIETLRREIVVNEKDISARNQTGELAQSIIQILREASSAVVEDRLRNISPLLQSIYSRIDPHPTLRLVTFLSNIFRGRGHLSTIVSDPIEHKVCDFPPAVLSSSQVNALAVSVFLALNIGVPKPPLSTTILDDPLQSLDDINLLGLVDLLRRTKDRRQLFVSTHDGRFGSLLSRKLRPRNDKERTIIIELTGWSRQGPTVLTREVWSDPVPLRLVASQGG